MSSASELRLGAARVEITPDWPLPLAGFAARSGLSEGVAQPLHLRVALLEMPPRRALVASADVLYWPPERITHLRGVLSARLGAPPEAILLAATHSHSGPQTSARFAPSIGRRDERFVALLEERLIEAATLAERDLEPVKVFRSTSDYGLAINRRRLVAGRVEHAPNPEGPTDRAVTAVEFRDRRQRPRAAFVHYTCHPVISQDNLISGEFPGVAMTELERETGAVCQYLQGFCGDVNPAVIEDGRFVRAHDDEVVRRGRELAAAAREAMSGRVEALEPTQVHGTTRTVQLPFEHVPSPEELRAASGREGAMGEWARALLAEPDRLRPFAELELQRLDLARGLSLLAANAEPVVEYGLYTRQISGGSVLPAGYSNGMLGYVPTARQIAEGGYESDESGLYLLLPSRFSPEIEGRVRQAIHSLAETVSSQEV